MIFGGLYEIGGCILMRESYSLTAVARLFRCHPDRIKERAFNGEFPYEVNERGHFVFSRESLLPHLDEMNERNNRHG